MLIKYYSGIYTWQNINAHSFFLWEVREAYIGSDPVVSFH